MMIVDSQRFVVASADPPEFFAANNTTNDLASPCTFTLPSGAAVGDWALVTLANYFPASLGISGGAGGWTYANTSHAYIAYKFLEAADIGATFTVATNTSRRLVGCALYRGATSVVLKGSAQNTSATPAPITGFIAANPGCVVSVAKVDSDNPEPTITQPADFTKRTDVYNTNSGVAVCVADAALYTGAAIEWSFTGTAVDRNVQFVFELTP